MAEVGILKGTGLAIWSDLFNDVRILGLDIDLGHINNNMDNLKKLGAFKKENIELHEFDQFEDNTEALKNILKRDKVDVFIDDGFHSNETILKTLQSALPYLSDRFVYFIEDNKSVHKELKNLYPKLQIDVNDQLTVLSR